MSHTRGYLMRGQARLSLARVRPSGLSLDQDVGIRPSLLAIIRVPDASIPRLRLQPRAVNGKHDNCLQLDRAHSYRCGVFNQHQDSRRLPF